MIIITNSESLIKKYEQQKQKTEAEYSLRYATEQHIIYLEQKLNNQDHKLEDLSRKNIAEIEMVIILYFKVVFVVSTIFNFITIS